MWVWLIVLTWLPLQVLSTSLILMWIRRRLITAGVPGSIAGVAASVASVAAWVADIAAVLPSLWQASLEL